MYNAKVWNLILQIEDEDTDSKNLNQNSSKCKFSIFGESFWNKPLSHELSKLIYIYFFVLNRLQNYETKSDNCFPIGIVHYHILSSIKHLEIAFAIWEMNSSCDLLPKNALIQMNNSWEEYSSWKWISIHFPFNRNLYLSKYDQLYDFNLHCILITFRF